MEIFNVNRQAYQHLGVIPWASKPASNTVPVGTRLTAPGLGYSDWVSKGTHWAPVDGYAVLKRKNLQSLSGAFPSFAEVLGAFDDFIIPDDLLQSPGAPSFEVRVQARRLGTLSAAQAFTLQAGTASATNCFGLTYQQSSSSSTAVARLYGYTSQISSGGNYQGSSVDLYHDSGVMSGNTVAFSSLSGKGMKLYAQNGSTDTSETWTFHYAMVGVHLW